MASNSGAESSKPEGTLSQGDKSNSHNNSLRNVLHIVRRSGQVLTRWKDKPIEWPTKLLTGWLQREASGNTADWRSPIYKRQSRNKISFEWDKIFQEVMKTIDDEHLVGLLTNMEDSQRGNISVQSAYMPWSQDGPEKVRAIYSDKPRKPQLDLKAWSRAKERTASLVSTGVLTMSSPEEAVRAARSNAHAIDQPGLDVTTNAGPPTYNKYFWPTEGQKQEVRERATISRDIILSRAKAAAELMKANDVPDWWAIVAKRLAQKKDPMKRKRIVIALEKAEAVLWKTFTPALMDIMRAIEIGGIRPFVAWIDLPVIDVEMQKLLNRATNAGRNVLSGDLASFDATIPPWMIVEMGEVMESWFKPGMGWIARGLCSALANNVNLITPNKVYPAQPSSMKSGSGGTNLLDSLCNMTAQFYGEEIGLYKIEALCVQGDDFVVDGPGIQPDGIAEAFDHFGMIAHPTKQMYEPNALSYLQRIHYKDRLGGISSTFRTLGSIESYERLRYRSGDWNGWVDVVRAISQVENTVFNPAFVQFVQFIQRGDKFELGANIAPSRVLELSGDVGKDVIQHDVNASWKSAQSESGFDRMLVNRVLRGDNQLAPQGSREFFLQAYGRDRFDRAMN